jgi:hypothetical protein
VLDESVEARLRDECLDDGLLFPDYERYCFAGVPGTVGEVLGADVGTSLPEDVLAGVDTDVENVVCVLVDGLGYDCWVRDRREHGFLDRVTEEGTVTPLTSIYHAETAAAITTVHTGDTAAEHGLLGWDVYLDEPGFVLETLPFRQKGGTAGDAAELVDPDVLYGGETVYERLAEAEIDAHAFQPAATIDTPYSRRNGHGSAVAISFLPIARGRPGTTTASRFPTSSASTAASVPKRCSFPSARSAYRHYKRDRIETDRASLRRVGGY